MAKALTTSLWENSSIRVGFFLQKIILVGFFLQEAIVDDWHGHGLFTCNPLQIAKIAL
jgi:hypothetical protein